MPHPTPGIHHVTAIADDPATNAAFYAGTLGLRLVKRTINFDDPSTYHLYYGDRVGTPGTAMTFFPVDVGGTGRIGTGQVIATAFAIPPVSATWWEDHLDAADVAVDGPDSRFGETVRTVRDCDGVVLELVEREPPTSVEPWTETLGDDVAIAGFDGVTIDSAEPADTAEVLELLGFESLGEEDGRRRFVADGDHGRIVDLVDRYDTRGRTGPGTVHHVAMRTRDEATQLAWRDRLIEAGHRVTPVRDRQYFKSIYFREPGGVLFELATDGPGFTLDEDVDRLGSTLKLPPWLDDRRAAVERSLPPLERTTEARG